MEAGLLTVNISVIYYSYLKMGVEGLLALRSFKVEDQAWGGDHDRVCKIHRIKSYGVVQV